jgi:hypothetical protein
MMMFVCSFSRVVLLPLIVVVCPAFSDFLLFARHAFERRR